MHFKKFKSILHLIFPKLNSSNVYLCGVNIVLGADGKAFAAVLLLQAVGEPAGLGVVEPLPDLSAVHHGNLQSTHWLE